MKFKKIELHAFRAYEDRQNGTFDFTLKNGDIASFISIYAPNGFGKTSFYDGVEWCLTGGTIRRFKKHNEDAEAEREHILDDNKQFILQNNKTDIRKNKGYVKIETDNKNYEQKIMQISTSPTADYVFKKRKIKNKFFQDVILSQESIDSFLNQDNDKDRYKKYSDNFGNDEDLEYHEKIKLLEKQNNSNLNKIEKNIQEIKESMDIELDETIFTNVNQLLTQLNLEKKEFELVNDSFDEIKKLELDNKISEKTIDLNRKIDYFKSLIDKLPSVLKDSEKYFNEQNELKIVQDKLDDYIQLNKIYIEIILLKNKLVKNRKEITYLEELKKDYPTYKSSIEILKNNEVKIKKYKEEKLLQEQQLNETSIKINGIKTDITLKENRKNEIYNSITLAPSIYENIKIIHKNIDDLKQKIESDKKIFLSYENEIQSLKNKHKKLQDIKKAIQNNIFIDIDSDDKYKTTVEKIESLLEQNESNNKSLSQIKNKKIEYQQYNKSLKELISLGINIIQTNQDSTCPLCNQKYSSYDTLQENILNNPLLDNIEKDLLKQEEEINLLINRNNKEIIEAKESIILDLDSQLTDIGNNLNELNYRCNQLDLEVLNKNLSNEESLLLDMLNKVEDKPKDEYLKEKNQELEQLTNNLSNLYEDRKNQEFHIKNITNEIEKLNFSLNYSSKIIDDVKLKKEYKLLNNWINTFKNLEFNILDKLNNDIESINNDTAFSKDKLNTLENKFDKLMLKYSLIDIENILQDIEKLKDEEFELAVSMKKFQAIYSTLFTNEIHNLETVEQDINKKKETVSKTIKEFEKELELIEKLQKNIDNLLKFVENKKRTKNLEKYKNDLLSKAKVQKYLKAEREKLEQKINNDVESFFHEDLINQIYSKIDPHPEYKSVKFKCTFENSVGKLNIFVNDANKDKHISPALYYSTAQLNVLS